MIALALALILHGQDTDYPGTVVVPACRNGAVECQPWERDWATADPDETDFIHVATAPNGEKWFVQNLSLVNARKTRNPKVWIRVDYSAVKTEPARSGSYLLIFRCDTLEVATLHGTRYRADGSVLVSSDVPDYRASYEHIAPGTIFSAVAKAACSR